VGTLVCWSIASMPISMWQTIKLHKDFSLHIISQYSANISVQLWSNRRIVSWCLCVKLESCLLIYFERIWRCTFLMSRMMWFYAIIEGSLYKWMREGSSDRDRIKAHCCMANHITLVNWPTQTFSLPRCRWLP